MRGRGAMGDPFRTSRVFGALPRVAGRDATRRRATLTLGYGIEPLRGSPLPPRIRILLCIVLLLASAWPATAESVPGRLTVTLEPADGMTVGDRVTAEVVLTWDGPEPVAEPRFPTWAEAWGTAEIVTVGEVASSADADGRRIYRQTVVLTAFRTGSIELPTVGVAVPLAERTVEVRSDPGITFEVVSVLGEGAVEPRAMAAPRTLAAGRGFPLTAAALAVLCLLAAAVLGRRLQAEPGKEAAAPAADPLAELLGRLAGLDPGAGSEPVHTGLSLALRHFLGRIFGIHARESTTREIGDRLRATAVAPVLARRAVGLLGDCDQVKFARLEVAGPVAGERLAAAGELAREIDAHREAR